MRLILILNILGNIFFATLLGSALYSDMFPEYKGTSTESIMKFISFFDVGLAAANVAFLIRGI